jgi:hypothetical protein
LTAEQNTKRIERLTVRPRSEADQGLVESGAGSETGGSAA